MYGLLNSISADDRVVSDLSSDFLNLGRGRKAALFPSFQRTLMTQVARCERVEPREEPGEELREEPREEPRVRGGDFPKKLPTAPGEK